MKKFALIGASGFIAPRHMRAIKETGNILVAAVDKFDSVGIIDAYFPKADFFIEFERFDRHIDKLRRTKNGIDYVSVCSPSYLHDAHIRFGLRNQADVICEKPLVLNPWNIDALAEIEKESGKNIYNILQLRLHPTIIALKEKVQNAPRDIIYDVELTYITCRGSWYFTSWKGDETKSGGIASNIGIHFFDILSWIFGELKDNKVHLSDPDKAAGYLEFNQARVKWFLSINSETLPDDVKKAGKTSFRSLMISGESFEFSDGFNELHTESYNHILSGDGFPLNAVRNAIEIVHNIRTNKVLGKQGDYHPFIK